MSADGGTTPQDAIYAEAVEKIQRRMSAWSDGNSYSPMQMLADLVMLRDAYRTTVDQRDAAVSDLAAAEDRLARHREETLRIVESFVDASHLSATINFKLLEVRDALAASWEPPDGIGATWDGKAALPEVEDAIDPGSPYHPDNIGA